MKSTFGKYALQALTLLATFLFLTELSLATTSRMLTDEQLITSSRIILLGNVQSVKSQWDPLHQNIFTYVKVDVLKVLKGRLRGNNIVFKELGGEIGEDATMIFGAPRYEAGQRLLLFLNTSTEGTLRVAHLFQGKFDVLEDVARGSTRVERKYDQEAIHLLAAQQSGEITNSASLDQFTKKIRRTLSEQAAAASFYEQKYKSTPIVEIPPEYTDEPKPTSGNISPDFTFLNGGFRWFEPDSGQAVFYRVNPSGAPTGDGVSEVNTAMAAWTNVGTSSITLFIGGFTSARGFRNDGVSAISYNDPLNQMDDPVNCSGVLAIGGFTRTSSQTTFVNGRVFRRILEGDVVFNRFFECFLGDPTNLAEVACHELGHTIGFGHSTLTSAAPGTDPTMRAFAYGNGRGARLGMDDVNGATFVYPLGGNPIDESRYFVGFHYRDFLNREPDLDGWDFWTGNITPCGSDPECIDRKRVDVSRAFWYAPEFLQNHPGLRNPPGVTPDFNNREFVRQCYLVYLRRDPAQDQAGWDFWTDQLNNDTANDPSGYNHLITAFLVSGDYRSRNFVSYGLDQ